MAVPTPAARVSGDGIVPAACIAVFAAFVAFALVADNPGMLVFARLRGALALLAFGATAIGATLIGVRGGRAQPRRARRPI